MQIKQPGTIVAYDDWPPSWNVSCTPLLCVKISTRKSTLDSPANTTVSKVLTAAGSELLTVMVVSALTAADSVIVPPETWIPPGGSSSGGETEMDRIRGPGTDAALQWSTRSSLELAMTAMVPAVPSCVVQGLPVSEEMSAFPAGPRGPVAPGCAAGIP
jgi:hypothetical protein